MIDTRSAEVTFRTNSAMKQVYLDDNLYKALSIHQVGPKKHDVARIRAALKTNTGGAIQDITSYNNLTLLP